MPAQKSVPVNKKPDIAVGNNHVVVCATYIPRPDYISQSQWLRFWERVIASELHER